VANAPETALSGAARRAADDLDMRRQGVAPVVVEPVAVPQPDGSVKPGAGATPDGRQR
jgi:rare lipoprotein A